MDIYASGLEKDKLNEFCNLFDLTNLVKDKICSTSGRKSTIDLTSTATIFFKNHCYRNWPD